jgi:tRNA dimethylallyltransferase
MVGGTGLYIKAFCEGMDEMPGVPAEVEGQL